MDIHAHFLQDLGGLLVEAAEAAKNGTAQLGDSGGNEFQAGRVMAYYEVLSLMAQQAVAFGLPASAIGFRSFEPESLLGS